MPSSDQPARLVVDLIPDTAGKFCRQRAATTATADECRGDDRGARQPDAPRRGQRWRRSRVIDRWWCIDPGHGGVDSGARLRTGCEEKDIVLAFALELQQLLVESGRFDVALTREDDIYLRLEERIALARQNKADLFISLHADSFPGGNPRRQRLYPRRERDRCARPGAGRKRERADIVAGFSPPEDDERVVDILVDLMRQEMRRQSYVAAQAMVQQLEPSVQLRRFPVRQADFFVLQAPDVPSVLIELGFLSNADDIANLTTDAWLDRVAAALARGVATYFDGLAAD